MLERLFPLKPKSPFFLSYKAIGWPSRNGGGQRRGEGGYGIYERDIIYYKVFNRKMSKKCFLQSIFRVFRLRLKYEIP